MSGAITIAEFVATLGVKIKAGEFAHVESALAGLRAGWEMLQRPAELALAAIRETAQAGDEVGMLSAQLGVAADAIQELRGAAVLADGSAEGLTTGLQYLARTAQAAADGSSEAAQSLSGIDLRDATGKLRPLDDMLADLADKVQALPSATERLALTMRVLGRGSRELVPLLAGGAVGLAKFRGEVRASGAVLTAEAVRAGEEYDDATKRLDLFRTGLRNAFASPAAVEALTEIQTALGDVAKSTALRSVMTALGNAATTVLHVVGRLMKSFALWLDEHPEVGLSALYTVIEALGVVALPALAHAVPALLGALAPILPEVALIVAAFGALYLVADDIRAFSQGADSVIGRVKKWLETPISDDPNSVTAVLRGLYRALSGKLPGDSWIYTIGPLLDPIFQAAKDLGPVLEMLSGKKHTGPVEGAVGYLQPGESPEVAAQRLGGVYSPFGANTPPGFAGMAPSVTTTIQVNVAAGTDAAGVGDAVARAFDSFWDAKIRTEFVSLNGAP